MHRSKRYVEIRRNLNHIFYSPEIYALDGETHLLFVKHLLYAGSMIGILSYLIFLNNTERRENKALKGKTIHCQSRSKNSNQDFEVHAQRSLYNACKTVTLSNYTPMKGE